jgi:hypothetical protein
MHILPCGTVLKEHDFHLLHRLPGNILNYYLELSYMLVKFLFATIMPFDATKTGKINKYH